MGHTISLQSTTVSYKNKKRIERPKSEQLRFENTHEPLVTQETWDIVQDIRKHKRLYEDNVLGRVTNEQFRMLSADYNDEQNSLKERIPQVAERINKLQNSISNVSRFVEKAKRYTEIPKLTSELLHLFIERIELGECGERYSRTAEQKIVIRYRDIGILGAFAKEVRKIAV